MKTNAKWLKRITLFFAAVTVFVSASARAEIDPIAVFTRIWTIGDGIQGETTLHAAAAVNKWDLSVRAKGTNGVMIMKCRQRVRKDMITGAYFYHFSFTDPSGHTTNSTAPFMLPGLARWTFTEAVDGHIETISQDCTFAVWMASVTRTGYWPDDGPWEVWLKTTGNKWRQKTKLALPLPGPEINFWRSAHIRESGYQVVALGNPNCTLNYPVALSDKWY